MVHAAPTRSAPHRQGHVCARNPYRPCVRNAHLHPGKGEISAEELLEAKLKVLGVTDAPTVDQSAVSGSEYVELDSDAGQSLLDACTSDRDRE